MDARDWDVFARAFHRAVLVFDKRLGQSEETVLAQTYFKVLQAYPLRAVLEVLKTSVSSDASFPKPMDVLERLRPPTAGAAESVPPPAPARRREMTSEELHEYADAASTGFQRPPCDCAWCVMAQVDQLPLRFVPTLSEDGESEVRAVNPRTQRYDVVGHWAHGEELKRWYTARDRFYAHKRRSPFARVRIGAEREPGEEG